VGGAVSRGVTPIEAINRLCVDDIAGMEIYDVERESPLKT
jgi:hypothetical protein